MIPVFIYLLKVILVSGILFGYYWIMLRNKKFHYYNRFYLLSSLLLSAVLPLLKLEWFYYSPKPNTTVHQVTRLIYITTNEQPSAVNWQWYELLLLFAFSVSFIGLLRLLLGILKLFQIKSKSPVTRMTTFDFIETSLQEAPFSFFHNLFWKKEMPLHDVAGQRMLKHELTHIQEYHSIDNVLVGIITNICWMNPFFWLIRRELAVVHEFIADAAAMTNNDASQLAEMLLAAEYQPKLFSSGQSYFYSSIKRRIMMLSTSSRTTYSYARRLLALPIGLGVLALLSFTIQNNLQEKTHTKSTLASQSHSQLDSIPAQYRDPKTGKLTGNFQIEIQGDIATFKDKKSKKELFTVPLNQLGVMDDQKNSALNKKFIFISGDSLTFAKGTIIKEKRAPRIIVNGIELSSADATNSIPPSAIKTIDIRGGEMNIKVDSADASFTYTEPKNSRQEKVYKIIPGKKQPDTIIIEDMLLEKTLMGVPLEGSSKKDRGETITVTSEKVDGNLVYTITKKLVAPTTLPSDILYIIDGKEADAAAVKALNPNSINSMNVLKGGNTSKYGEKGKNGVIEIITKK